jgi:hypothetical protein
MPRALLVLFGLLVFASAALLAAGCLDSTMPATPRPDGSTVLPTHVPGMLHVAAFDTIPTPDAGVAATPDLLPPPPPPDLRPSDLTGLIDCYDRAYCDSSTMMCIRFFGGTPGQPQPEKVAPSCYGPNDPCPNGTLDCTCIQQDATLGLSCAECFANPDGTFTCYAQ